MRLAELNPVFIRYETRVETWDVIDGDHETWRERGCPTKPFTGPRQYMPFADGLADAQGIRFLCPACFAKNGGARGTHAIDVTFAGRDARDDQGSHNRKGEPSRWIVSGASFDDLTLSPSIDVGCWHGYITNGDAR